MSEIQGKPVYGVCGCKQKVQVLSVEQAIDLIQQMAANGWQVPADYVPKTSVNAVIDQNTGTELKLWIGTQAKYDALTREEKAKTFALITDDPTLANIEASLKELGLSIDAIDKKFNSSSAAVFGDYIVSKKKLLWSGDSMPTLQVDVDEPLKEGDVLEVVGSDPINVNRFRLTKDSSSGYITHTLNGTEINLMMDQTTSYTKARICSVDFICSPGSKKFELHSPRWFSFKSDGTMENGNYSGFHIYKIYKVIE